MLTKYNESSEYNDKQSIDTISISDECDTSYDQKIEDDLQ